MMLVFNEFSIFFTLYSSFVFLFILYVYFFKNEKILLVVYIDSQKCDRFV